MIRLKQKKPESEPAKAAETPSPSENGSSSTSSSGTAAAAGGLKLLGGVGGKQTTDSAVKIQGKKKSAAELRIQKDIAELDGGTVAKVSFANPDDLMNFHVTITPDGGLWGGASYRFSFTIPDLYPHSPPKVRVSEYVSVVRLFDLSFSFSPLGHVLDQDLSPKYRSARKCLSQYSKRSVEARVGHQCSDLRPNVSVLRT